MTLATFNHYVDNATAGNKTGLLSGRHGARHVGRSEGLLESVYKMTIRRDKGRHSKTQSRHGKEK